MKKTDASRAPLSLPARLGILALVTLGGVFVCANYAARQTGTDVSSYLGSINLAKAYSKQNLNYALAETKFRMGDRNGAAALAQKLPLVAGTEEFQNYNDLREAIIKAQLGASEFAEALRTARDMSQTTHTILTAQLKRQGRESMLAQVSPLTEPERSIALGFIARQDATQGNTAAAEYLVEQMVTSTRASVYPTLTSAYYKAGDLTRALTTVQRLSEPKEKESALLLLGQACAQNQDYSGMKRVLELCPAQGAPTVQTTLGTYNSQLSTRHQILQSAVSHGKNYATLLELIRTYAPRETAVSLCGLLCTRTQHEDRTTYLGALAFLRTLPSKDAQVSYDSQVQQLFYGNLKNVPDPLSLALSVYQPSVRRSLLTTLGEFWLRAKNNPGVDQVLKQLRTQPDQLSQEAHDALITTELYRAQRTDPARARQLAQQLLNPQVRQRQLSYLDQAAGSGSLPLN